MVKTVWIIFLLILLNFDISIEEADPCSGIVSSTQECLEKLSDEDKEWGYKCCYYTSKGTNALSECRILDKDDFEDINSVISDLKDRGFQDPNVDCKSKFLETTLLIILIISNNL